MSYGSRTLLKALLVLPRQTFKNVATITDSLFFLTRGKIPTSSDLEWEPLKAKLELISSGALSLLVVEPVYVATIILLASEIELEAIVSENS